MGYQQHFLTTIRLGEKKFQYLLECLALVSYIFDKISNDETCSTTCKLFVQISGGKLFDAEPNGFSPSLTLLFSSRHESHFL